MDQKATTVVYLFNAPAGEYTLKLESCDAAELSCPVLKTDTITIKIEAAPKANA